MIPARGSLRIDCCKVRSLPRFYARARLLQTKPNPQGKIRQCRLCACEALGRRLQVIWQKRHRGMMAVNPNRLLLPSCCLTVFVRRFLNCGVLLRCASCILCLRLYLCINLLCARRTWKQADSLFGPSRNRD